MDQSLIKIYVKDAVPKQNFLALVLMGGYGRGEGGYCLIDGKPAPYNDYDYFLVVKDMGRKEAAALQASLHKVALRLSHIVGVEVDLAVLRQESLASAPFSLMNAEMKWGHRVVLGDPRVLEIMPAMPIDKLSLGEFTRLMNNRGALLLMNIMALDSKRTLEGKDLEEFFKYLFKAILACGDALLARNGSYHPSYVEKQERLKLLKSLPCPEFLKLYKLAVEQKFYPNPDLYQNQDPEDWQTRVTNCWLTTLSILEAHRTRRSISDWKEYARPRLPKGQLENAQVWRNIAITFRDFGMRHTLRYLDWARRYPRERLISVLPLLLARNQQAVARNISIPLNIPLGTDWAGTAEGYLSTWKRYA
jgi:hypothetical protein